MNEQNKLIPFEGKEIRKIWHDNQWFFSVIDIIEVLTESATPRKYWNTLKTREPQLSSVCGQLKLPASDGKKYKTDCANTEGVLRIVMSVPSSKAEPLKLWLAQVGTERIEETENPELAFERAREIYRAKGYPEDWIGYREKSMLIRRQLTDEWQKRGIKENTEYAILTAEIAKATFGLTPTEHANLKGLEKQNLRDHMTNLELIFSALGEESARIVTDRNNAQGFTKNRESAIEGGNIAGDARERFELKLNEKVVTSKNFLNLDKEKRNELPENKADETTNL